MSEERKPIGHVTAEVRFPIFEGDKVSDSDGKERFPWFEYREPGITDDAEIGLATRECETVSATVEFNWDHGKATSE